MHQSALIIGASGDIGTVVARRLAKAGWSLYLHYFHSEQRVLQLQVELQQTYPKQDFFVLQYDLTEETHLDELTERLFQVDALIFAAGITTYGLFSETTSQQIEQLWEMHIKLPMLLCQRLAPKLAKNQCGRIIFVGSVYGGSGSAMEVGYSTVKGAQSAFANAYAKEVASLGITVNVVAPGAVDTQMNKQFSTAAKENLKMEIPASRLAQPDEIAYWVAALLDPAAGYLTGQTIYVSGGWRK
ncbi:elongation factor P 5-aminopentanone reductase [Loigolactobacillus iwatensis]|uniref:elongation factor P 5-aminopentanone reductase n=1 Tax=Loigolactobacillus iwatensis TaxID=1267156 RepID=UPI000F7F6244|nr:SDR family NAD(P)-dependent oxidoreductase [Loigolactobacillus iwatensis]